MYHERSTNQENPDERMHVYDDDQFGANLIWEAILTDAKYLEVASGRTNRWTAIGLIYQDPQGEEMLILINNNLPPADDLESKKVIMTSILTTKPIEEMPGGLAQKYAEKIKSLESGGSIFG